MSYVPINDGIDHINVYTKAKTELGRLLTNLADVPLKHPKYGDFKSMEGLWYFLRTGRVFEDFRKYNGFEAKKQGQKIMKSINRDQIANPEEEVSVDITEDFKNDIIDGIKAKLRQNKHLLNLLIQSNLPLCHYYYYGEIDKNPKVVYLPQHDWQIKAIEDIRDICQKDLKKKRKKGYK